MFTKRLKLGFKAVLAGAFGMLVFLVLCELLFVFVKPPASFEAWLDEQYSYVIDEHAFWSLEPRRHSMFFINKYGFRGDAVEPRKREGIFRIVVLGGSSVFGYLKSEENTWPAALEEKLRKALAYPVEVINAGCPGYNTWNSVRALKHKYLKWNPDLVLVYHLYNDWVVFPSMPEEQLIEGFKKTARAHYISWLAHPNSVTPVLALAFPKMTDFLRGLFVQAMQIETRRRALNFWFRYPPASKKDQLLGLGGYEKNLREIARLAKGQGAAVGLITQAALIDPRNFEKDKKKIKGKFRGFPLDKIYERFLWGWEINKQIAEQEDNVFLLDAKAALDARTEFFIDDVHLSIAGVEYLSEFVARQLIKKGDLRVNEAKSKADSSASY